MAKSVIIVSDLSGEADARSHRLALDDVVYELDLTEAEFADLAASLSRFTAVARRETSRSAASPRGAANAGRRSRSTVAAIKQWGRANDWHIPERGRLPHALVSAYQAATGSTTVL